MILSEPRFGAYALLFAGLHPSITKENNGAFGESNPTLEWKSPSLADLVAQLRLPAG